MVGEASGGRLEVLPLAHEDVRRWRAQALGATAPSVPTLLKVMVQGNRAQAWTGVRMGARLAGRLGPRGTVRVLRALGGLDHRLGNRLDNRSPDRRFGRRNLLKLGAGAGVAAGLVLAGKIPAFAAEPSVEGSDELAAARAWAKANQTPGAGVYDEFARFGLAARRAIFTDLAPDMRSQLWLAQLSRYRRTHPSLTLEQARILDQAMEILANASTFAYPDDAVQARVSALEAAAIKAFGRTETCQLMFTLGPAELARANAQPQAATCTCRRNSSCNADCNCASCATTWPGCGCFWVYTCNGRLCA